MTVIYPVSGLMMSGAGGYGIYIFGVEILASNYDEISGKAIALNETISGIGHEVHELLVPVIIILILAHVVGALKHHFIGKGETIKRMFTFK